MGRGVYNSKIKIAVYHPVYSLPVWGMYINAFGSALIKSGYDVYMTSNIEECIDYDIVILYVLARYCESDLREILPKIYNKGKFIVFMQSEQICSDQRVGLKMEYIKEHINADVILETTYGLSNRIKHLLQRPVISCPCGYDESFTLPYDFGWLNKCDVFTLNNTLPRRKIFNEFLELNNINCYHGGETQLDRIANYARSSKMCLYFHAFDGYSALPGIKIIGLFISNGGFVIAERCPNYPYLEEDKHIVYFDTKEEMVDKIRYYLEHQDEAKRIANNAFEHVKNNVRMDMFVKKAMEEIMVIKESKS